MDPLSILGLAVIICLIRGILSAMRELRQLKRANKALERCKRAKNLFDAWRAARPFLYVGQCPYAQGLVLEVISQYKAVCDFSEYIRPDTKIINSWRALLNELPPDYDPPEPAAKAGFLFLLFLLF
jgi:hypothetical protein